MTGSEVASGQVGEAWQGEGKCKPSGLRKGNISEGRDIRAIMNGSFEQ